jgi:hypothetical protein
MHLKKLRLRVASLVASAPHNEELSLTRCVGIHEMTISIDFDFSKEYVQWLGSQQMQSGQDLVGKF